jgi:hypothetical protein
VRSLVGVWKLVKTRAFDDAGRKLLPPLGRGGRQSVTAPDAPPRFFIPYTGTCRFDGARLGRAFMARDS